MGARHDHALAWGIGRGASEPPDCVRVESIHMSNETLLQTNGLTKQFGKLAAVDTVDFELQQVETHGLIGPNGAGKTTFFNLLSGTLTPTAGTIHFNGMDITALEPNERAQNGIGRSFQVTTTFEELKVRENVRLAARSKDYSVFQLLLERVTESAPMWDRAEEILRTVGLADMMDVEAGSLSHGNARRLDLAIGLANDPDILLLDEPTAGLPSEEIDGIVDILNNLDTTILLVEHRIPVVAELCDRVTILHQGEILVQGDIETIQENEQVKEIYLGKHNA
jgi:branched-chain amino acid transport system ATP-binding protein